MRIQMSPAQVLLQRLQAVKERDPDHLPWCTSIDVVPDWWFDGVQVEEEDDDYDPVDDEELGHVHPYPSRPYKHVPKPKPPRTPVLIWGDVPDENRSPLPVPDKFGVNQCAAALTGLSYIDLAALKRQGSHRLDILQYSKCSRRRCSGSHLCTTHQRALVAVGRISWQERVRITTMLNDPEETITPLPPCTAEED